MLHVLAMIFATCDCSFRILDYKVYKSASLLSSLPTWLCLSNQKQPSCKKRCGPQKGHGEKRCEIQGGGQEMAVMVG